MTLPAKFLHRDYTFGEIVSDAVVHVLAIVLGLAGFAFLIWHVAFYRTATDLAATLVYATGFFAMFGFSFAYNIWPHTPFKWWLRRLDHAAIYLMIAGSCTAFLSQIDDNLWAGGLISVIWICAIAGMAAKLLLPGRFERAALVLYLLLGWVCFIGYGPIVRSLPMATLMLMLAGGLIYSSGVFFYKWKSLRYHNTIWHGFVALAAACHFAGVTVAMTV